MFNVEGFIPKLYQLAQKVGEDERAQNLCSAGLHKSSFFNGILCILLMFSFQTEDSTQPDFGPLGNEEKE